MEAEVPAWFVKWTRRKEASMGYTWAIPIVILALLLIVVAIGARRRRRSGADQALNKNKPVVP
jgi:hypothetical protein